MAPLRPMWGIEDATVAVRCWRMNKSFGMLVTVIIIQACRRYWLIGRVLLILEASDRIWIVYEVQGCRADLWQITYRTYLVSLQTFVNPIFRAYEVLKNDFYVFVGAEIVVVNECCNERLHSVALLRRRHLFSDSISILYCYTSAEKALFFLQKILID